MKPIEEVIDAIADHDANQAYHTHIGGSDDPWKDVHTGPSIRALSLVYEIDNDDVFEMLDTATKRKYRELLENGK